MREQTLDSIWLFTGLPSELRPLDIPTDMVTREEWPGKFVACMNDAGYDSYTALTDGYQRDGGTDSDEERIANYVCEASYRVPEEQYGYLNAAQQEYVYDYYAQMLVPCLMDRGVEPSDVPTREQFSEAWSWNPYQFVESNFQERPFSSQQLHLDCPTLPPGVFDPKQYE